MKEANVEPAEVADGRRVAERHPLVEQFELRLRGAARSARHPVTVEIVGSNPIEDAFGKLEARNPKLEKKSDVLVEQRSARDPATVEIVGSNPTGDSLLGNPKHCGTMRERE